MKKILLYNEIKKKIINCDFPQGTELNEKDLSIKYGLSRTPIREALVLLETEGWIKRIPRKGYIVSALTFADIKDLFQIRYELEPIFLKMAYNFFEKQDLLNLKNEINKLIKSKKYDSLREIDDKFHKFLLDSTYNKLAIRMMEKINEHISRTRYLTFRDKDETISSAQEHLDIINALLERNLDTALDLLRKHLDKSQLYFIRNFNFKG